MTSTDIHLLLTALASVLLLVALIVSRVRMHPLVALLVVCVGVGLATGMELGEIAKNITNGAGKTLGAVGVVIALGAMLGKILADAGITEQIANALLRHSSDRMIPWAMTLVAFIVGIPMFFEVGLVVMLPLVFSVLTSAKVGDAIVHLTQQFAFPPLVLGWLIAMLLSVSTGSATVGIVGAAGLLAPLAGADPALNLPLLALSIGSGSLFFNYANHAGFWLVKESFSMSMGEATRTITVVQSIVALVGLGMVLAMNAVMPLH